MKVRAGQSNAGRSVKNALTAACACVSPSGREEDRGAQLFARSRLSAARRDMSIAKNQSHYPRSSVRSDTRANCLSAAPTELGLIYWSKSIDIPRLKAL